MRVLVTGGAGFIGSRLSRRLARDGHRVTAYDDLSNSSRDALSGAGPGLLELVEGDVTDAGALGRAVPGHDAAVHLAAQISVQRSVELPEETMRVNVEGTACVAEACRKAGIEMVAASSAAVYGDTCAEGGELDESSECRPISPYGQSKLDMERYLRRGMPGSVALRLFNVYGPGQSPEYAGVISRFASRIREGRDLVVHGDGLQTRDFVAVDDAVEAAVRAIGRLGAPQTYCVGTGVATTVGGLAGIMLGASGSGAGVSRGEAREGDIRHGRAGTARAREGLGFECGIPLRDGIARYWDGL